MSATTPFFNLSVNTDALSSLFSGISDRFDKLEQRAKLFEDRSLQMLDALTEATQRLTVSENQYAAVFDTVSTLQKTVNDLVKNKVDKDDHHQTIGKIDDQLGQLRVSIEVVDSRKQEVDIPALMKRVMQEARDNAAKMLIERETEQRRYLESMVHEKTRIISEDVNKKTDLAMKTAEANAQNAKKEIEETSSTLTKRVESNESRAQSLASAIEHLCTKFLMTENNLDALSDLVRDDVGEARQLVSCICHSFNVNLDSLLNSIPSVEKHAMLSDSSSETNTLRNWKWERLELLRKQAVVDSWGPIKNVSSQEFTRKLILPSNYSPVPDANVALTKRDELVRAAAANRRREMMMVKQQQQQDSSTATNEDNNNEDSSSKQQQLPESGKLFLASPLMIDVETRAVEALRSDMSVLQQKIASDSLTQIQQLDKVVRSKISFDRAQALVNEAAGVAAEKCVVPIKESVETVKKTMLTRENALALLAEKVNRVDVVNLVEPAIEEAARNTRTSCELYTDSAVNTLKNNLEKQVAGVRDRCHEIDRKVSENEKSIAGVGSDVRAIQLKAAGYIDKTGSDDSKDERCLSCGNELVGGGNNKNQPSTTSSRQHQQHRTGSPRRNQQHQQHSSDKKTDDEAVHPAVTAALHSSQHHQTRVLASSIDDVSDRAALAAVRQQQQENQQNNNNENQNSSSNKTGVPPLASTTTTTKNTSTRTNEKVSFESDLTTAGPPNRPSSSTSNRKVTTPTPPATTSAMPLGTSSRTNLLQQNNNNNNNNNNNTTTPTTSSTAVLNQALGRPVSRNQQQQPQQQQQQPQASNWYQQMDDAFQARTTTTTTSSSSAQQQQQPNETSNNRPTSARTRPTGAWSSMKK